MTGNEDLQEKLQQLERAFRVLEPWFLLRSFSHVLLVSLEIGKNVSVSPMMCFWFLIFTSELTRVLSLLFESMAFFGNSSIVCRVCVTVASNKHIWHVYVAWFSFIQHRGRTLWTKFTACCRSCIFSTIHFLPTERVSAWSVSSS